MGYVIAGYGITLASLGAYAVWVLRRARSLDRRAK
jgi:heme exporter protein CcmD